MNYIKNIKNAALYSPYEVKVRDLTSNDPFAGNAQRARKEVAEATSNYENFLVTMRVIWERLNDTGRHWRHVYKGLQLLEYLLVYGAENVVLDAKNNLNRIKILTDARHFSSVGAAAGAGGDPKLGYVVQTQPSQDGNSVDLDRERAAFVDNTIRYESTLRFINGHVKTMLSAITGQ